MRRSIVAVLGAALLSGALVGSTLAATPQHARGGPMIDQDFAGPQEGMCTGFGIHWYEDGSAMQAITFPPRANGDVIMRFTGPMVSVLTNLSNDHSVTVWSDTRLDFVAHTDGTFDLYGSGRIVVGYRAIDDGGPGLWLLQGTVHDKVAADMITTTKHDPFVGRAVDLCKMLE